METYTDSDKISVAGALATLPVFGCLEDGKQHTEKDTEILVQGGQSVSKPVTSGSGFKGDNTIENIGESHGLAALVISGHAKSNGGERGIRTPDTV